MNHPPLSRRAALRTLCSTAGLVVAMPLLAACGGAATATTSPAPTSAALSAAQSTTTSPATVGAASTAAQTTASASSQAASSAASTAVSTNAAPSTSVTAAAAATKAAGSVEFWHPWTGQQYEGPTGMIAKIDAAFNAKHPDLTITPSNVGSTVIEKLLASVAAGTPPDVVIVTNGNGDVYSLAYKKVIQPVEAVAGPDLGQLKDWFYPAIWDLGVYQGKVWALPMWSQGYAMMWNTNEFQQAGLDPSKLPVQTLDELPQLSQKLSTQSGNTYTRVGFWDTWFDCCSQLALANYAAAYGGKLMDVTGTKVTANDPNNVKALQWIVDYFKLIDVTRVKAYEKTFGSPKEGPYLAGKYAMWRDGPWRLRTIQLYNLPRQEFGVGPMPPPAGVTGGGQSHYGDIPVIPTGAKQTSAWQFIRFLTGFDGPETYAGLLMIQPQIPNSESFTKTAAFKPVLAQYPGFDIWLDQFYGATHFLTPPKIPTAAAYFATLKTYADKALSGALSAQIAMDQATAAAQHDLDVALATK
jgi:multiple sugar transport system substrate-binding protein